jgi:hypothetical protein
MASFWADVLAHSAFFIGFLPIFYFTYVAPVQSNALTNDIFDLLKDQLTDLSLALNPNVKAELDAQLQKAEPQLEANPGLSALTANNPTILKWTLVVVCLVVPIFLGLAGYLEYQSGGSIYDLFLGNFIVLAFIAVSEFAIVGLFVSNFIEIDKDFVKATIFKRSFSESDPYSCRFVYKFAVDKFGQKIADMFFG